MFEQQTMIMSHLIPKAVSIGFGTFLVGLVEEKTGITFGLALSMMIAWGSAVWWIGRKLQALEDGIKIQKLALEQEQKMVKLEFDQNNELAKTQREAILALLDALPCNVCKEKKHHETDH